jgi:hypothetical protein
MRKENFRSHRRNGYDKNSNRTPTRSCGEGRSRIAVPPRQYRHRSGARCSTNGTPSNRGLTAGGCGAEAEAAFPRRQKETDPCVTCHLASLLRFLVVGVHDPPCLATPRTTTYFSLLRRTSGLGTASGSAVPPVGICTRHTFRTHRHPMEYSRWVPAASGSTRRVRDFWERSLTTRRETTIQAP